MRQNITIIGAGLAGLLAGNILRRHKVQIVERQSSLPNNHHAVLRFRTERVADACHIPFKKVRVFKEVVGAGSSSGMIAASMMYSSKVVGRYELRSIINTDPCDRFIAPPDFIEQCSASLDIAYGVDGAHYLLPERREEVGPVISTLPMPILMDALEYEGERPAFDSFPGFTVGYTIPACDAYCTLYIPQADAPFYRVSITGDKLIVEFIGQIDDPGLGTDWSELVRELLFAFGIDIDVDPAGIEVNRTRYAKLAQMSTSDRRKAHDFMLWASMKLNVYSLGRFATWRSGLLLDDVVDDVLKIERWMGGSNYDITKGSWK